MENIPKIVQEIEYIEKKVLSELRVARRPAVICAMRHCGACHLGAALQLQFGHGGGCCDCPKAANSNRLHVWDNLVGLDRIMACAARSTFLDKAHV